MSLSSNFPTIRPSLNLDFAKVKRLDPRITFTRASTATYYDGVTTAKAEENLLTLSQEIGVGPDENWENSGGFCNITANSTAAPDGTTTADTIAQTAVTNVFVVQQRKTLLANTNYTFSVFVKDVDINYVAIALFGATSNAAYAEFNLTTGALSRSGANGTGWAVVSTAITAVGGSWYRISAVITTGSSVSTPRQRLMLTDGVTAFSASGTVSFTGTSLSAYFWGAQLEQRSAVTAYTPTTTQPVTNYIPVLLTAPAGTPRFDHNPVTDESLGFLVEEQRANIVNYSADFSNASWIKSSCTVSSNTIVAPDGTLTGDKIVEGSGTVPPYLAIGVTGSSAGVTYTMSCYAKAAERSLLTIFAAGGTNAGKTFNISNGTLGATIGSIVGSSITPVGNNWYRCSVTVLATAAITVRLYVGDGGPYAANGFSGIYVWGAQVEAGAFPTSYIATVASSVTRAADAASMTGTNFSEWYDASEGTLYGECLTNNPVGGAIYTYSISDGTNSNYLYGFIGTSSTIRTLWVGSGGVSQVSLGSSGTAVVGTPFKFSAGYKENDFAGVANNGTVLTDTSGVIPVVNRLYLGASPTGTVALSGTIKKIAYYPERLTNAQLQALTS